jgi:hypothetical protein
VIGQSIYRVSERYDARQIQDLGAVEFRRHMIHNRAIRSWKTRGQLVVWH